jgi:hypothetical protein
MTGRVEERKPTPFRKTASANRIAFSEELRTDSIWEMLTTLEFFPFAILKRKEFKYTKLYFYLKFCMAVKQSLHIKVEHRFKEFRKSVMMRTF